MNTSFAGHSLVLNEYVLVYIKMTSLNQISFYSIEIEERKDGNEYRNKFKYISVQKPLKTSDDIVSLLTTAMTELN